MFLNSVTNHQLLQQQVINNIEEQVRANALNFTTVSPIADYANDPRISLTSVHLPDEALKQKIHQQIIDPLREIEPDCYYYMPDSLHMTIKNIRIIDNPPRFTEDDVEKAKEVFSKVLPRHKQFNVYFYRLLLFPNNLALIGTTDPELDSIILALDNALNETGIPDDKTYTNTKYFFCNMTLARFNQPPSEKFKQKIQELSDTCTFTPYTVDSITLLTCNAVLTSHQIKTTWQLKKP